MNDDLTGLLHGVVDDVAAVAAEQAAAGVRVGAFAAGLFRGMTDSGSPDYVALDVVKAAVAAMVTRS